MLKSKKAQTGETISWVIATLVIIGILILFVYISTLMANVKTVSITDLNSDLAGKSLVLAEKTSLAYQLSGNTNKEVIDKIILQYDK
jgi:hypothetical protein